MADATWRCSSCDTYNDVNAGKCQVCDEPHTMSRPERGNGAARTPGQNGGPTWQCRHCDVWNDTARKTCQGCEMSRLDATRVMDGAGTSAESAPEPSAPAAPRPTPRPAPRAGGARPPAAPVSPPGGSVFGGGGFEMPPPFGEHRPIFFSPEGAVPMGAPVKKKGVPGALIAFLAVVVVGFIVLVSVAGAHGSSGAGSDGAIAPNGTEQSPDSSSPADASSGSGQDQAQSIDDLLAKAGSTRSSLRDAIDEVSGCSDVDSGVSALEGIVDDRESQVSEAQDLQVDALDGGDDLKNTLVSALSDSLSADRNYLSWARSAQDDGCDGTAPLTGDYNDGNDDSAKAGEEKSAFIDLWTPIAAEYQLTSRTDDDI